MRKNLFNLLFLSLCFTVSTSTVGQEPLTLDEAVSGAYTTFAPQGIPDLKWIPGGTDYSFLDGSDENNPKIMRGFMDGRPDEVIFDFKMVFDNFRASGFVPPQEIVIPSFTWMDKDHVLFSYSGQYWRFSPSWDYIEKYISCTNRSVNRDISPDMTMVANTIGNDLFYSTKTDDTIRVTTNPEHLVSGQAVSRYEFGINKGTWWSPDSKRLAFYEKDESQVTEYGFLNYGPIPAEPIPTPYPMAGQSSETVKVKVFDFKSGNTITLMTEGSKEQYLVSVAWTADSRGIYVGHLDRSQNEFELFLYDARTGEPKRRLFSERNERYVEPEHAVYPLEGTKGEFVWFSERDGFQHLYHYASDGKLIRQLTEGERVMKEILHYDEATGTLIVSGTDGPLEQVIYRVSIETGRMERITKRPGYHRSQVSEDGRFLIDRHSSLEIPQDIRILDMEGRSMRELLSAPDPLKGRAVGTTELLTLKAEDGTDLHARLIKPSDFDPDKKYPVLVYVYGGPHVQLVENRWLGGASLWMHHLCEQDFLLFSLDGRGSSDRGLAFEQAVHRQLGRQELADQMMGVEYLKSLPYVDEDRMAVHGWSFGGFMTLNMMLRKPGTFQTGVAGGAVIDWRFYEVMYTERYMDGPEDNQEGYDESALPQFAGNLDGDLMLIHCTNDDIVVPQHYMVMMNAFINAGQQVDMFMYPGHGHNVRGPDRVHLMRNILNYVMEHLEVENG